MLQIRLLGQFDLRANGVRLAVPSRAGQSLFAYLVLTAGTSHRREKLAALFWPDTSDESARRYLRQELWRIRKAVAGQASSEVEYLLSEELAITFNPQADYWLDVAQLERRGAGDESTAELVSRLELYRGELLPGFYDDWVILDRERLQGLFDAKMQQLIKLLLREQRWTAVLEWGERWIALGQTPEPAYRALMVGYAALGDRAKVTATYERCAAALEKELGVEASPETRTLYQELAFGERELDVDLTPTHLAATRARILDEPPAPGEPPFKGLQYFDENDVDLFFGREMLTARLVGRLGEASFLAVIVGASGSGKSSVVRAGVIPALKKGEALADGALPPEGSAHWQVHLITPTAHPLEALALALTREAESVSAMATLMDDLARDPRSLYLYLRRRSAASGHVLIVIDQFEELFTLCRDEFEREAFIDNLLTALTASSLSSLHSVQGLPLIGKGSEEPVLSWPKEEGLVTLILTIRADFYAHLAQYPELREAVAKHQEYMGPMSAEELRRAIEEPAKRGGWEFEPGVVDLMLRDVGDEPGALPLLSHALLETWKRRSGRRLTLKGYSDSGGVRGAIAQTAETVYQQLTPAQQSLARDIFLRLTELGEGTEDTRRRASFDELISNSEDATEMRVLVSTLAEARLVTLGEATAEVAHEALIREWQRLREWLNQDREGLRLHRQLTEAAHEWELLERDPGALYRGARLAQAREWAVANPAALNAHERAFLNTSIEMEEREEVEREAQRQRELVAAQKLASTESRAAARLRQRALFLAGALAIALLMAGAALFFGDQARRSAITAEASANAAEKERRTALSRELAASAIANMDADPDRGLLLAMQAVSVTYSVNKTWTAEAETALHRAVQAARTPLTLGMDSASAVGAAFSPDGSRVVTSSRINGVNIWDVDTGKELLSLPGLLSTHSWLDRNRIATEDFTDQNTRVITFWDIGKAQKLSTITLPISPNLVINAPSNTFGDLSPDWARGAWAQTGGTVKVFDLATANLLFTLRGHTAQIIYVRFSPDGARIATASADKTAKIWDVSTALNTGSATGKELFTLVGHTGEVTSVVWSPDGKRLVTASTDGTAKVWNAETGAELLTFGHTNFVIYAAFDSDGTRIGTVGVDGKVIVWDISTRRQLFTLFTPETPFRYTGAGVEFSPDGEHIVIANFQTPAIVWDLSPAPELPNISTGPVYGLAESPDGTRVVTSHPDNTVKVWDMASGRLLLTLSGHTRPVTGISYSRDGRRIATASDDKTAKVWDAATGKELLTVTGHDDSVQDIAFSPDGTHLATASEDKTAKVWDVSTALNTGSATGKELFTLKGHIDRVMAVAFSPDGTRIATASDDRTARVWDAVTGKYLFNLTGHSAGLRDILFSPDGKRLVTASQDGTAKVWDAATGRALSTLSGHTSAVLRAVFSADGTRIATASADGTSRVWDAATGKELLTLYGHTQPVNGVAFSPDGTHLITSSEDGTVRQYLLRIEDLMALARTRLTRTWTVRECQEFLHVEQCPHTP